MDVFLVTMFLRPTAKATEEGDVPKIVVQPTAVMAKDASQAAMKAQRLLPPDFNGQDDRLEVRVLPFRNS